MRSLWAVALVLALITPGQAMDSAPYGIWIVSGEGATDQATLELLGRHRVDVHVYDHLEMLAIVAGGHTVDLLRQQGLRVDPNEVYPVHLDQSVPRIGADKVQQVLGAQRDGPTVLVIDTGLDSQHPDFEPGANLAANVGAERTENGLVSGVTSDGPVLDSSGHGSHVAGIVAGSGAAFGQGDPQAGKYRGVYSNGRVASFQAASQPTDPSQEIGVELQAALQGFEWGLANQQQYKIGAITNSWGSAGALDAQHPAAQASLRAYAAGMTVFFSAGNEGEEGTLNRHCLPPWVLCIASGTLDGTRSSFSSMGNAPARAMGPYDHPDLTAPGSAIRSAEPVNDPTKTARLLSGDAESLYRDRSGTSMAAPHAAAVAGLLLAANPGLSPDQVMDILVDTADPMSEEVHRVGSGYISAEGAYNLAVQTIGQRESFLRGDSVKYGGAATGDATFAQDPVSVGYDSESGGALDATLISGPKADAWIVSSWIPGTLLAIGLLVVLAGIRWRRTRSGRRSSEAAAA